MAVESLAKRGGAILGDELAAYTSQLLTPAVQEMPEGSSGPYVGFADPKNGKYDQLVQSGVKNGDAYLSADGRYTKLDPFEFHLLAATRLWVQSDDTGKVVLDVTDVDPRSWKSPYKENIEAAILVYSGDTIVPAKCSFRTTKAGPGRVANNELASAGTPEWAKQSKDHATIAGKLPVPFSRFFIRVETTRKVAKGSGLPMYVAEGTSILTTPAKADMISAAFKDENFRKAVAAVMDGYTGRVKELQGKIKGR
jgi:hypothetical protein